jgi:hypothetical protein
MLFYALKETATTNEHKVTSPTFQAKPNTWYTFSCMAVRASTQQRHVRITLNFGPSDTVYADFDIANLTVSYVSSNAYASVDTTTHFPKIILTYKTGPTVTQGTVTIANLSNTFSNNYLGDTSQGVVVINPQLEESSFATTYTDTSRADEFLSLPASVMNSDSGTIEIFARTGDIPKDERYCVFLAASSGPDGYDPSKRFFIAADLPSQGQKITAFLPNNVSINSGQVIRPYTDYYIAFTYSSSDGYKLYINGTLVGQASYQGAFNFQYPTLWLGQLAPAYNGANHLTAVSFYGVAFSDTVKSANQISATYNSFLSSYRVPVVSKSYKYAMYIDNDTGQIKEIATDSTDLQSNQLALSKPTIYVSAASSITSDVAYSNLAQGGYSLKAQFKRNSLGLKRDGTKVSAHTPRFENGKYGKAIMVEEWTMNLATDNNYGSYENYTLGQTLSSIPYSNSGSLSTSTYTITVTEGYRGVGIKVYAQNTTAASYVWHWYGSTRYYRSQAYTISEKFKFLQATAPIGYAAYGFDSGTLLGNMTGYSGSKKFTMTQIDSGWSRFSASMVPPTYYMPSVSVVGHSVIGITSAGTYEVIIDEAQLEPKSYPTGWVDGYRADEVLYIPASLLNASAGTLAGWFQEDGVNWRKGYIFATDDGSLEIYKEGGKYKVKVAGTEVISNVTQPIDSAWHHIAVAWNGTSMWFYLDGVQQASATLPTALNFSNATWLYIGSAGPGTPAWNQLIDDVRISSTAWSTSDVARVYNATDPATVDDITDYKLPFDNTLDIIVLPRAVQNISTSTSLRFKLLQTANSLSNPDKLVRLDAVVVNQLKNSVAEQLKFLITSDPSLLSSDTGLVNVELAELFDITSSDEQLVTSIFAKILDEADPNALAPALANVKLDKATSNLLRSMFDEKFNLSGLLKGGRKNG